MAMTEKIKILLVKRNLSAVQLAEKLNTTPSNIYNKFKRDYFSESDLEKIADALDCDYNASFQMHDTGEII